MDGDALERTAALIGKGAPGAKLKVMTANVAEQAAATSAATQCLAAFGQIDILVNNAAMRNYSAFADATPEEWQAVLNVNMIGNANFCRAALPAGLWVLRLKAPFDRQVFTSPGSVALLQAARDELLLLLQRAAAPRR